MTTMKTIEELNRELGDQVYADAKKNPQKYSGRYIGIANYKVICSGDDREDVINRLKEIEPDTRRLFFVDAKRDLNKVLRISETWYTLRPLVSPERPSGDPSSVNECAGSKDCSDPFS